jgi:cytochrome P450
LASTPRVYCRLQQEIDDSIASGQISSPITAAEGKRLPYLQAFIRECLRFNPPVSILVPKVVPPGGDVIDGKSVPAGTQIAVDFPSMGRRKDIYGEDAEMFRPERFLEASPERRAVMEKTTDLMFGHGRYLCPGKTMAWLEANKVFVEVRSRAH